jgi:hypothetical protein
MPDLDTVKQFAQEVRACDGTVRNWIKDGVIPVYHVNRFIRIDRQAALEALQNFKRPRKRKRQLKSKETSQEEEAVSASEAPLIEASGVANPVKSYVVSALETP